MKEIENPIVSDPRRRGYGVSEGTVVFLRAVVTQHQEESLRMNSQNNNEGIFQGLDIFDPKESEQKATARNAIGIYFGTCAALRDLRPAIQGKSDGKVRSVLMNGMRVLWQNLDPQIRATISSQYTEQEIFRFKPNGSAHGPIKKNDGRAKPLSEERKQALSDKRLGKPSGRKGKSYGFNFVEMRRKIQSGVSKNLWQDPEYRKNRLEKVRERRYAALSPKQQQVYDFFKRNRKQITWADDESIKRIESYLGMHSNLKPAQKHWKSLSNAVDLAMKKIADFRYERLGADRIFYDFALKDEEQIVSQGIISPEELSAVTDYVQGKSNKKPSDDLWDKLSLAYVRCKSGMK